MTGLRLSIYLLVLFLFGFFLSSCGVIRTGSVSTGPVFDESLETGTMLQTGLASWYGPKFHGKPTANGEIYNMDDFTAAHRTLPFNTVVRVTNPSNGKTVDVRINDRGPYIGDRIIDLSRRAAREIDMINSGTANVEVYLLQTGDRPVNSSNTNSIETFTVQLASFDSYDQASQEANQIRGSEVVKVSIGGNEVYRVYHGSFTNYPDAEKAMRELQRHGHNGFVKQKEN